MTKTPFFVRYIYLTFYTAYSIILSLTTPIPESTYAYDKIFEKAMG